MRFSSESLVSSLRNHAEFDLSGKNISLILFLEDRRKSAARFLRRLHLPC